MPLLSLLLHAPYLSLSQSPTPLPLPSPPQPHSMAAMTDYDALTKDSLPAQHYSIWPSIHQAIDSQLDKPFQ